MSRRIVVVGLGLHGTGVALALADQGDRIVGAADPEHAGESLGEILRRSDDPAVADVEVDADAERLLARVQADVAVIAAPVEPDELQDLTFACLDAGLDVLTIHEDAFDPPPEWAAEVDRRARLRGRSVLATGVQDVWWVHLPAVAAAATTNLTAVRFRHAIDLNQASEGYGRDVGVGEDPAGFATIRDEVLLTGSSILGGPMRALARCLGLTPGEIQRTIDPVIADHLMRWEVGDADVAAGTLAGFSETSWFDTDEGVHFTGTFFFCLLEPDVPYDEVVLDGDPQLRLEHRPFPGDRITDVVPAARLADLVAAPPGLLSVETMPPARYRHGATRRQRDPLDLR